MHFPTTETAQAAWIESLNTYAILKLPPADVDGIILGDVAVGTERSLNFIRANIGVRIRGVNGNSVMEVAKEIDEQIIMAIEETKD